MSGNARSVGPGGPLLSGYRVLPQDEETEREFDIAEPTSYSPAHYRRARDNSEAGFASQSAPPAPGYGYPPANPCGMDEDFPSRLPTLDRQSRVDESDKPVHDIIYRASKALTSEAERSTRLQSMSCCQRWYEGHFTIVPAERGNVLDLWGVVEIERGQLLDLWDIILIFALFATALMLPFEVALLTFPPKWWEQVQSAINWIFIIDMLVTFNIAYEVNTGDLLEEYERAPLKIAANYMAWPFSDEMRAGWFWPDLFTCLPWDWISDRIERNYNGIAVEDATTNIEYLRIVRLLKLFRIFRLVRVGKLFRRWHTAVGFSYAAVEAFRCLAVTVFTCHWLACAWSYSGLSESQTGHNWLTQIASNPGSHLAEEDDLDETNPIMVYNLALYWATMTLTTVGYGDVIPQSMMEVTIVTMAMILTSFIWAYVLGSVVSIIENRDVYHSHFSGVMDDLNTMLAMRDVEKGLRKACRDHLHQAYHIHRGTHQQKTIQYLSPQLQGKIAIHCGMDAVCDCIPYLKNNMHSDVLVELAQAFRGDLFSPKEYIYDRFRAMVIRRGQALFKGRLLTRDSVLGIDMILVTDRLRDTAGARTLGFVEVMCLHRDALWEVAERHHDFKKRMRKAQIKLALFRGFVHEGRKRRKIMEAEAKGIRVPPMHVPHIKPDPIANVLAEVKALSNQISDLREVTTSQISSLGARITSLEERMSMGHKRHKG